MYTINRFSFYGSVHDKDWGWSVEHIGKHGLQWQWMEMAIMYSTIFSLIQMEMFAFALRRKLFIFVQKS